ncbi:MAG TPA: ATP-dependent helicase, partial [Gaiellaceae bacterium]|nr:ATP-dependent helicase [Gaiellaceae bacterium]
MDAERILEGLNAEQRAAAEATRGPVCILAGAGTGKTTTITRRIAWQVASGAFPSSAIVAVTFTDKAAGELRGRLAALGVEGVRASTFHSAALALLRRFGGDPGRIMATKALLLRRIGNSLPKPYRFRPAGDLATEVEWAKNRRLTPATYLAGLGHHEPPLPADLAHRVFREYERRKAEEGALDFEDLLERAIRLLEE